MRSCTLPVLAAVIAFTASCSGGGDSVNDDSGLAADLCGWPDLVDAAVDVPVTGDSFVDVVPDAADAASGDLFEVHDDYEAFDAPTDTGTDDGGGPGPWRSSLYPDDWTPAFTDTEGRFLHDFSYAGYHNGEAPVQLGGAFPLVVEDITTHGADPTGATDSTAAIQAAIDAVASAGGGSVYFPEGLYRIDGRLFVTSSFTVLRGDGADKSRLHFTQYENMGYKAHLDFRGTLVTGFESALKQDAGSRETSVFVLDPSGFAVGDDVQVGWVITPKFVEEHGMTGTWKVFNNTWQVFFRREVTGIDPASGEVELDVPLRYPAKVRDQASLRKVTGHLRECGVESLGVADAVGWDEAWINNKAHVIEFNGVMDSWITGVESFVSPLAPKDGFVPDAHLQSGGILLEHCKRVVISNCVLGHAQNLGGGGNGYLYEIRMSNEILVRDCVGEAGRHNFIQNWGFGLTGCVFLRITSRDGKVMWAKDVEVYTTGPSEYHHSLATANLVDSSVIDDGWNAVNRGKESSGAGHSATECVMWNTTGGGHVNSYQYGWGYVIGSGPDLTVQNWLPDFLLGSGTEPEDFVEGEGAAATLVPQSLYEDQLARRLLTND